MRREGRLKTWNDDRGFGFVVPDDGLAGADMRDVFVHVSELPPTGRRPTTGERLSFEVRTGPDGRPRAVALKYLDPGQPGAPPARAREERRTQTPHHLRTAADHRGPRAGTRRGGLLGWPLILLLAVSGGVWLFAHLGAPGTAVPPASSAAGASGATGAPPAAFAPPASSSTGTETFRCDGRRHCSQMSSCAEATWVLRHCPGTEMDGDGDGIPCEGQFCGR